MARYNYRPSAEPWFAIVRHDLRHGRVRKIVETLNEVAREPFRCAERTNVIKRVAAYLHRHRRHLRFRAFKNQGMPLGSGFVESAVKWLIQQRFKGVGMRWSEDGFNHLLHLRLAWANGRFDLLLDPEFSPSPI